MPRTAEQIQQEIEQARVSLATTVDELAERANPKHIADDAKNALLARAQSPQGKAVIGGVSVLIVVYFARNLRKAKRNRNR
ncbi:uncharacterized protein DUF3618 [Jatrophihabitans sp. GAS493]|uniref:DUF3618 domain-containing protein n=1 Tax=Jatrophihabitans sp. GAS493 TaxID=1907575 RepID=UPI000BB7F589|nr:DUF3618 domain-containing protein [Jatrophihabitans sp. GAS493]SOD72668.1 uncharacterized protein DUF3618 [Jatrophihabitans sp. GAS493]